MDRTDLLTWIRRDGSGIVDRFLPLAARAELEGVIRDGRHKVHAGAYLMFVSIRALLHKDCVTSSESDREAGQIMALLNA